ncbi:MAG: HIRAN domain-containing protein [Lachnospiraceae bacterium]|nr:HIRAN domain-containing protein [Lachnospiraceae bacterium]
MKDTLFTITGLNFRYGTEFLEKGMKVKLVKEPDNEYDAEAIRVEYPGLGKIGYVANSAKTVIGECLSAGRLYDRIEKKAKAKVVIVLENAVICKTSKKSLKK